MEISDSLANLANQIGQNMLFNNGSAQVRRSDPPPEAIAPPSAVYHGSKDVIPDIGYKGPDPVNVRIIDEKVGESTEAYRARISTMFDLITGVLGETSIDLKHAYDLAMTELSPELAEKDWGFSVSNGDLSLWENSDSLSESDRTKIKTALSDYSVEFLSNKVADTTIAGIAAERGPQKTSQGIGKYDLTEGNFGEIVDLRAYLDSHTEGGKYELQTLALSNPHDDRTVYMFSGMRAMMDQISARADPKYAE